MTWDIAGNSKLDPILQREGTWSTNPVTTAMMMARTVMTMTGERGNFEHELGGRYRMGQCHEPEGKTWDEKW